jgi:hypothetical protein
MSDQRTRFAIVAVLVLVLLTGSVPGRAHAAGTTAEQSQQVVRDFFAAYDRHDLAATIRFFGGQLHDSYADCNYATGETRVIVGDSYRDHKPHLKHLMRWFKARFAEHDHFDVGVVYTNPRDPSAVGMQATRTSDTLVRLGLAPLKIDNDKMRVVGSRLYRVALDSCPSLVTHAVNVAAEVAEAEGRNPVPCQECVMAGVVQ